MADDISRLRSDIGADATSLPDEDAQAILDEAGESYTDTASRNAYARVIAIRRLFASSARLTTYQQNASMERLSDVFDHLGKLLGYWHGELDKAERAAGSGAAVFGRTGRLPRRIKEYPG